MTANVAKEDRQACIDAGMDDYLAKPIRVDELTDALKKCQPLANSRSATNVFHSKTIPVGANPPKMPPKPAPLLPWRTRRGVATLRWLETAHQSQKSNSQIDLFQDVRNQT